MKTLVAIKSKEAANTINQLNNVLENYDLVIFVNRRKKWSSVIIPDKLEVSKCKKDFYFFDKVSLQLLNFLNEKNVKNADFLWYS